MGLRRFARSCLVVAAVALVVVLPAGSKEGARATLTTPVPTAAPAGTTFRVAWIVTVRDENGRSRPFGACGMFVRLLSPIRGQSVRVFAQVCNGRYRATVRVPKGGMRGIQLGLRGYATDATHTWESDLLFPITNNPFRTSNSPSR